MQVSNAQLQKVLDLHLHRVYGAQGVSGSDKVRSGPDQLILSTQAADMQAVKGLAVALPDMRVALVKEYQSAVESGEYTVNEIEVAETMLATALRNASKN